MNFFPLPKLHAETVDCNENNIHVRFLINYHVSTRCTCIFLKVISIYTLIIITHSKDEN